jgi:exosortase
MNATQPGSAPSFSRLVLEAACLAAAGTLVWPALLLLSRIWERFEYFGHGYLIPAVSAVLLLQEREEIASAYRRRRPPALGWLATGAAALLVAGGVIGDAMTLAGIAIPILILATLFAIGGRELAAACAVPVGFLLLMVPPPGALVTRALVELKLWVTTIAIHALQLFGVPVAATGNQIHVPGHTLFVADACSGLTSIVTLVPLACVVAWFVSHGLWRRALIVAAVVPLAMLANVVRVVVTVLGVERLGIEFAQGLLHESFGLATYVVGTIALLGVAKALR